MAQVSFHSNLGEIGKATEAQLAKAAEIIGGMAESYAKQVCPVDTGNLRNSITHSTEDNGHTVVIGTNVEYAPHVEMGTVRMRPRPYLRPAIEQHIAEYQGVLQTILQE